MFLHEPLVLGGISSLLLVTRDAVAYTDSSDHGIM